MILFFRQVQNRLILFFAEKIGDPPLFSKYKTGEPTQLIWVKKCFSLMEPLWYKASDESVG